MTITLIIITSIIIVIGYCCYPSRHHPNPNTSDSIRSMQAEENNHSEPVRGYCTEHSDS